MITLRDLPALNALLNSTAALLLIAGYILIRRRRPHAHRTFMLSALAVSAAFLASYLLYHFQIGSVRFQKTGPIRTLYFAILISHTILAAAVPPLALLTLRRALKAQYHLHRRLARITLPLWLYVSLTGVAVYYMLYLMP